MKRIVLALAAAVILTGCGSNRATSPLAPGGAAADGANYSVAGSVTELLNDATLAIANAAVQLAGNGQTLATRTGMDGEFRFDQVPGGAWTLTVSKPGFVSRLRQVIVSADARVDIGLEREDSRRTPRDLLARPQ